MTTALSALSFGTAFTSLLSSAQAQSYSSYELYRDWRFAIDQDFVTSGGEAIPYADGGEQEWGDEIKKLTFEDEPTGAVFSADGQYIAVAAGTEAHVFDTTNWEAITTFRGHEHNITSLAFDPADATIIVSGDLGDYTEPASIFYWIVLGHEMPGYTYDIEELRRRADAPGHHIDGQAVTNFQSNVFSPSGKWMAYLGNGDAQYDIGIYSTDILAEKHILKGHTDFIMWLGWSPDETYFASVSWDATVRIWDAETGEELYKFTTDGQNWTGAFSPDSKYFASTCGQGQVQINDLSDGSLVWLYQASGWRRAISWHPDNNLLAVGGEKAGEIIVLDVQNKEVVQQRTLSAEASNPDSEDVRSWIVDFLEAHNVKFVDGGDKLAFFTTGDGSAEVYDFEEGVKWRFARGGTVDGPHSPEWRDENGKVTSQGGFGMAIYEGDDALMLASVDADAVRIWSVPLN